MDAKALAERLRSYADSLAVFESDGGFTEIGMTHAQVVRRRATDIEAADMIEQQAAEIAALKAAQDENRLICLLVDLRYALGDDGKRMQEELVPFASALRADADAFRTAVDAGMTVDVMPWRVKAAIGPVSAVAPVVNPDRRAAARRAIAEAAAARQG